MVSVDFGDGYKIWTPDEYNVVLIREDVVSNPKAKNYGKTVERRMGYYGNLEQALNAYKSARIMEAKTVCNSVELLSELLRQIDRTIKEVCGNGR